MKTVEIVLFIKHLEKSKEIIGVFSSLAKADKFCLNFSKDNDEYGLSKNPKNKRHWKSDSYNYSIKIVSKKVDIS